MQVRKVQMVDLVPSSTREFQELCIPKYCKDAFTFRYHFSIMLCISRFCIWTNIMSKYQHVSPPILSSCQNAKQLT